MLAKAALILNGLALLPALAAVILLVFLGSSFTGSSDGSDRQLGWIGLIVGIPLLLSGPLLGLWLALKPTQAWSLPLSCGLGAAWLLLAGILVFFLPGLIEAAVRP